MEKFDGPMNTMNLKGLWVADSSLPLFVVLSATASLLAGAFPAVILLLKETGGGVV